MKMGLVRRLVAGGLVAFLLLRLAACGGGGGGGGSAPPPPPPTTLSGVAATGAPLAGATVVLKDRNGTTRQVTTANDGTFTVDVTTLTAPFLLQVTGSGGSPVLFSAATASGTTNVHPYTDLAVRAYYQAIG